MVEVGVEGLWRIRSYLSDQLKSQFLFTIELPCLSFYIYSLAATGSHLGLHSRPPWL